MIVAVAVSPHKPSRRRRAECETSRAVFCVDCVIVFLIAMPPPIAKRVLYYHKPRCTTLLPALEARMPAQRRRQLIHRKEEVAPRARFELATLRLTAECSTVELPGNGYEKISPQ